jgi:hypothetical protein
MGMDIHTKTPARNPPRPPRKHRILPQHLLRTRPIYNIPLQPLSLHTSLHATAPLAPDLQIHSIWRVDEHTISLRADPERHVLIRLITRRPAIRIPYTDVLPQLVEGPEPLAEAVDIFAYAEGGLGEYVV